MPERVVIVGYDREWPIVFDRIAAPVREALGELAVSIDHVGSTSVPECAAKPIIDLDVVVASEADVPAAIERLESLGYQHSGDQGVPGREAFEAPEGAPNQHLYLVVQGNQAHANHIHWRDLLRRDPTTAREYSELKATLAEQYRDDREGYTEAKTEFIGSAMNSAGLPFYHP